MSKNVMPKEAGNSIDSSIDVTSDYLRQTNLYLYWVLYSKSNLKVADISVAVALQQSFQQIWK